MPERETATRAEIAQRVVYWRKRRGLTRKPAHGLLRSLLDRTSGESARLVRDMAARAGVTA